MEKTDTGGAGGETQDSTTHAQTRPAANESPVKLKPTAGCLHDQTHHSFPSTSLLPLPSRVAVPHTHTQSEARARYRAHGRRESAFSGLVFTDGAKAVYPRMKVKTTALSIDTGSFENKLKRKSL